MRVIPTSRKERLPKGFTYPLGAQVISAALDDVPQLEKASLWFQWRDDYWASEWREKLAARGEIRLLEVGFSPLSGERVLYVYSVPSEYSVIAREHLIAELPRVREALLSGRSSSRSARLQVTLRLAVANHAANKFTGPNAGGPRQLPIRTPLAARGGQFGRSATRV
jgi:hypothetical protein